MTSKSSPQSNLSQSETERRRACPLPLVYFLILLLVLLTHLTLLHLPYFWDEGGYYVPAALDFLRTGTLIPVFTNAHPPLPSIVLGTAWHVFGFHILVTRLTACAFAAGALTAVFFLGSRLLGRYGAVILTLLTGIYPIWFAQSSLAHADIFAAAFTLAAFALCFTSPEFLGGSVEDFSSGQRILACSLLFCLSVLSKETAVVQPSVLGSIALVRAFGRSAKPGDKRAQARWAAGLFLPIPVLAVWFGYHFLKTGQVFGNPVYLRYNATDNFTVAHILYALRIRFVHIFWQRNIWVPLTLAAVCLLLPTRPRETGEAASWGIPYDLVTVLAILIAANLVTFSVLGGALLTRYLLPVYPLLLLLCIAVWRARVTFWPWLGAMTAAAFIPAIWVNPPTFFAPEDNLTYRNMIVVQQQAIDFLNQHYPDATVLTAWPVSADLFRPELGYTTHPFRVISIEDFTSPELAKASQEQDRFDTAIVFTTHYTSPPFRQFLLTHPTSWRGRRYAADLDLPPALIAKTLGGRVVWQNDLYGEWAAIIRFDRSYDAQLVTPLLQRTSH